MNKLKIVLLIVFAVVILGLLFFLFKNINSKDSNTNNDKIVSEIKYMDDKLSSLLNGMNNINLDNYKISITKTSTNSNSQEQSQGGSSSNNSEEGKESESSGSGESQGSSRRK